jgi:hypothetical protein
VKIKVFGTAERDGEAWIVVDPDASWNVEQGGSSVNSVIIINENM